MAGPADRGLSGDAPPGFRLERGGSWLLAAREDLLAEARARGLAGPGGLGRALAEAEAGAEGRGATAVLAWAPGGALVLRRLLHGGWLAGLLGDRFLGPRRPLRELAVHAALRARGAPVPEPALALGERRRGFWRLAYATRLEPAARDALAFLAERPGPARLERAAAAAGCAVRALHDAGGLHADLHVKNLLVREVAGGTEVIVIDLDRAELRERLDAASRMAQLMRLARSLEKRGVAAQVGARGAARFLAAYCAGDRDLRRALLARLPAERRRLARHRLGWKLGG